MKRQTVPDDRKIADLWLSPYASAAVTGAIEVGLTEAMGKGARTPLQLAKSLSLHVGSVESVLRVLVAMGFAKEQKGKFVLAADAQAYLVPSSPLARTTELSQHFETNEHKFVVRKLREVVPALRTFGDAWKGEENEQVRNAAAGMDSIIKAPATAVVRSGAFRGIKHLLDVGGGSGAFAASLTEHLPKSRVTILDLPAMCQQAQNFVQSRKAQNIQFFPADFFKDPWPTDCDAIFFSNVLHDWPEKDVSKLLELARGSVMHSKKQPGHLYVLEVLRERHRNGPLMATVFHMQMQMAFGGAQYTRADFAKFFKRAGFTEPKIAARFGYYSLLKAKVR